MIHVDKDGNVILKGEPKEIAEQYGKLTDALKNERYKMFVVDVMKRRLIEHLYNAAQIDFGKGELDE